MSSSILLTHKDNKSPEIFAFISSFWPAMVSIMVDINFYRLFIDYSKINLLDHIFQSILNIYKLRGSNENDMLKLTNLLDLIEIST